MRRIGLTSFSKILAITAAALLPGCYYDNEATLYPDSVNCDTTTVSTFSATVMPLLNARCNNCHAGTSPSGGIKLDSYTEVMKYLNDGRLMGSIKHASGFSAMPKNGNKLTPCEIQRIQRWIDAGALND